MKRGFTLIEALVTTAILALMALSAFPFLSAYQAQLDLEEAALALQNCFVSASDYARAPSAGAVSYQARLEPANRRCVVERVTTAPEVMDEYEFGGVDFSNSAGLVVDSFTLQVETSVLHTVTYSTVTAGVTGQAFGSGSVNWILKPTGKASPQKILQFNLVHGIITLTP
jgi:prepilin-type N-terminal cleavage/methylation domain-containing protein